MYVLRWLLFAVVLPLVVLATGARSSVAQTAPAAPTSRPARGPNAGITNEQLQQLAWLRFLQGRSGGGVRRGVPQFVPFGNNQMPFGYPMATGGVAPIQGQNGAAQNSDDDMKSSERRTEAQAAREERKRKTQERAEKRKAELAERRAKAAANKN